MRNILTIAIKDIRLLLRDRMSAFFVLGFPLLMGLFFGLMMSTPSSGSKTKMKVALVDEDQAKYSKMLAQSLGANENIAIESVPADSARKSVQSGNHVAMMVIPSGFGDKAGLFWEQQPAIQIGVDPSRSAEGSMLEGFLMEAVGSLVGQRMSNPSEMLSVTKRAVDEIRADQSLEADRRTELLDFFGVFDGFIDSFGRIQDPADSEQNGGNNESSEASNLGTNFQFANIDRIDVTREIDPNSIAGQVRKLRSRWDISFPQAMLWGILGCVAGFAISIAQEREAGTLLRLYVAPLSRMQLLCGKALACFLSAIGVILAMTVAGYLLGMRPLSYPKLALASVAVSICFVGITMAFSTLGRSVQSVSGIGWAANMIMAMIGGCMIPTMFMPPFISKLSILSPVKWAIQGIEGAIWRDFTWMQMSATCSVLVVVGFVCLMIGLIFNRRMDA